MLEAREGIVLLTEVHKARVFETVSPFLNAHSLVKQYKFLFSIPDNAPMQIELVILIHGEEVSSWLDEIHVDVNIFATDFVSVIVDLSSVDNHRVFVATEVRDQGVFPFFTLVLGLFFRRYIQERRLHPDNANLLAL